MDKWHIKRDVFAEWKNKPPKKTYKMLSEDTGLSTGAISNAVNNHCSIETIELLGATGLKMPDWRDLLIAIDRLRLDEQAVPAGTYPVNWGEFADGAKDVGKLLFRDLRINAVLTFPGPSLIFAGLAMAKVLLREEIIRMPVYTAIFVDKRTPAKDFPQFDQIPMPLFKLLVPRALMENFPDREKRIGVFDDVILTGKTMDALRNYFDGLEPKPARVEFACHFCNDSQTLIKQLSPKCYIERPEKNVSMPWGNAFSFESCFEAAQEQTHE